jgi:site-specific recombinase XerD
MLAEIEAFVNWAHRRSPQAHSWRDYACDLKQFVALVGDRPPTAIAVRDIDHFVTQQAARSFSAATINRRLATLISFYTYLSDDDPTLVCPILPHRHMLSQRQRLPRPLHSTDLARFFAVISDGRDRAMFLLMLRCGLRISEVASLHLQDLYLDEACPRLVTQGKGSKERSVYLSPQATHALRAYLAQRPSVACPAVFLTYQLRGVSSNAIHKRLMRYRAQAGVSLTAHRLRHTFANDLLQAETPVTTIQKLLGHRWLETTQNYLAANDAQVRADYQAAVAKLEGWQ